MQIDVALYASEVQALANKVRCNRRVRATSNCDYSVKTPQKGFVNHNHSKATKMHRGKRCTPVSGERSRCA